MDARTERESDKWVRELLEAGWRKHRGHSTVWINPDGDIYRGPAHAWEVMKAMEHKLTDEEPQ